MPKSRISSFLKYGIGEVFLVVIGILIAIQINNWNERRNDINKVNTMLMNLQDELASDVEETEFLIGFCENVDEVIDKILDGEITEKMYEDPQQGYMIATGTVTYPLVVTDITFKKLSSFDGYIPNEYQPIMEKLNELYVEEKMYLDELFTRWNTYTLDYYNRMFSKHEWMAGFEKRTVTPEMVDFLLNDPFHKNHITRYQELMIVYGLRNARRFKSKAALLYYDIEEQTKSGVIPDNIKPYAPFMDSLELEEYTGDYTYVEGENTIPVKQEGNRLFQNYSLLLPRSRDTFDYDTYKGNYISYTRDENDKILQLSLTWDDSTYLYNPASTESMDSVSTVSN